MKRYRRIQYFKSKNMLYCVNRGNSRFSSFITNVMNKLTGRRVAVRKERRGHKTCRCSKARLYTSCTYGKALRLSTSYRIHLLYCPCGMSITFFLHIIWDGKSDRFFHFVMCMVENARCFADHVMNKGEERASCQIMIYGNTVHRNR